MIRHILSDGTETSDIRGHLVKREEVETVYRVIEKMRSGANEDNKSKAKKNKEHNTQDNHMGCSDR